MWLQDRVHHRQAPRKTYLCWRTQICFRQDLTTHPRPSLGSQSFCLHRTLRLQACTSHSQPKRWTLTVALVLTFCGILYDLVGKNHFLPDSIFFFVRDKKATEWSLQGLRCRDLVLASHNSAFIHSFSIVDLMIQGQALNSCLDYQSLLLHAIMNRLPSCTESWRQILT